MRAGTGKGTTRLARALPAIQRHSECHSSPRLCAPHLSPQERNKTFRATRPNPQHPPPTWSSPSRNPGPTQRIRPASKQQARGRHTGSSLRALGGTPPRFRGLGPQAAGLQSPPREARARGLGGRGAEEWTRLSGPGSAWDGAPPRAGGGWEAAPCRLPLRGPGRSGLPCGPRLTSGWRHAGTDGR